MDQVLIIVGDASETLDTLYPYYRLIEGGYQPVVAAPEKRRYQMVLHEVKPGWTITKEWEGYTIEADVSFAEIDPSQYLGIFFSGGRARVHPRRRRPAPHHAALLRTQQAHRQRLPRRGNPRPSRLRQRPPHGHGPQVQVRPGNLRRHLRE